MSPRISYDRRDESLEAKARWFQSLTVQERLEIFSELTEVVLAANPRAMEAKRRDPPLSGRVQILRAP